MLPLSKLRPTGINFTFSVMSLIVTSLINFDCIFLFILIKYFMFVDLVPNSCDSVLFCSFFLTRGNVTCTWVLYI